jgi:outer membrane PBP1 activator LpoA protein
MTRHQGTTTKKAALVNNGLTFFVICKPPPFPSTLQGNADMDSNQNASEIIASEAIARGRLIMITATPEEYAALRVWVESAEALNDLARLEPSDTATVAEWQASIDAINDAARNLTAAMAEVARVSPIRLTVDLENVEQFGNAN